MQLPPVPRAFFQFFTGLTLASLAKFVSMTNWRGQQDLLVSPAAEPAILPVDSDNGHELWPPTNLRYPVVALLLQWAPMEAWEDLAATPAALETAVSPVLDSLLEEHGESACRVAWLGSCNMQRN
jgi:hypothetical protein